MIVTGWNNGRHYSSSAGYGIKISPEDRDKYFNRKWRSVSIKLPGKVGFLKVNVDKKSFWTRVCGELAVKDIGIWLKKNARVPWPKGNPPKMVMEKIGSNKFEVKSIVK